MPNNDVYDLKSAALPRLSGSSLRLFVRLLESPASRWLLLERLLREGGITRIRKLVVDAPPTFIPSMTSSMVRPASVAVSEDILEGFSRAPRQRQAGLPYDIVYDYVEAYRDGSCSPEEVAQRVLEAIADSDRGERPLRAFIANDRQDLMIQAQAAAQRYKQGKPLSPLDGVPVAVKDEFDMLPYGTSLGTSFLGHQPARDDATIVARLRSVGALLIGKTNMHEIGIGVTGQNPHHGTVRNPFHPGHHTGGSSSGPAAAVAAGICPLALGADGGGSIRIPASFCGVVGLKPTQGRVSEFGSGPLAWSVDCLGPIGATARDAALGYLVMAGPDPKDPNTFGQPQPTLEGFDDFNLTGLTFGIFRPWFKHASSVMVEGCEDVLEGLEQLGAQVQEIEIRDLDAARIAHLVTIGSEIAAAMDAYYQDHRRDFSLEIRINLALARALTSVDYVKAQRIRTQTIENFERAFEKVDVIVTPSVGLTAPPIRADALPDGDSDLSLLIEIMRFATPANLTGHPAISVPAGYDEEGLPIGIQFIGRAWQEHVLLRLAHAVEQIVERKTPQVFYKIL
jgi:Asp-tRNA(Asn)/Glu-tRNA(Gln) amidotransferase A subunit family amidase